MGSPEVVVDVPNRKIDRVVVVLTGCHRNGCFVAPKDDRDEECPMCVQVSRYEVLL